MYLLYGAGEETKKNKVTIRKFNSNIQNYKPTVEVSNHSSELVCDTLLWPGRRGGPEEDREYLPTGPRHQPNVPQGIQPFMVGEQFWFMLFVSPITEWSWAKLGYIHFYL